MHWNAGLKRVECLDGEFDKVNFAPAWASSGTLDFLFPICSLYKSESSDLIRILAASEIQGVYEQ